MTLGHRIAKAASASWLILGAVAACGPGQTMSPSASMTGDSYYLARHATLLANPMGLAEGTVDLRANCLYLGPNLLIWPEDYSLIHAGRSTVIVGDGWTIAPGDSIIVGGGQYNTAGDLPSPVIGGLPPCAGPYLWVSEVTRVGPSQSD